MADQCIVCLESLDSLEDATNSEHRRDFADVPAALESSNTAIVHNEQPVAIIKTCGHILHDECLSAWTQKANSCPICRQAFNLVEVYDKISGNHLTTRTVEDRKQVAEFDPSAWIDEQVEDIDSPPCPICGSADDEEVLLLCDACDAPYHTHCVGLERVPNGHWFCMECVDQGANEGSADVPGRTRRHARQPRTSAQRTQAQARRARLRSAPDAWQGAWSQISARVWDALNLDLENDDDDNSLGEFRRLQRREDRQRQEFRQWQQRLAIAGRQGARDVFRGAASPILHSRERHVTPEQSIEEQKAWDAFDKARDGLEESTPTSSRKRKQRSITASPAEPRPSEPERKLKRPRTRRLNVEKGPSSSSSGEAAGHAPNGNLAGPSTRPSSDTDTNAAPSFLSSLLKEVEMSTPSEDDSIVLPIGTFANSPLAEQSSPASSNYSTPRAMSATPPPHDSGKRPGSPLPLTSRVEPIYPPADYSPNRVPTQIHDSSPTRASPELRQPRPRRRHQSPTRSPESSPTRAAMSIETKEDINKIVRHALEPHYKKPAGISKEQYASINRLVSRMLYDRIATLDALDENKSTWEKIANAEVTKAVEGLSA